MKLRTIAMLLILGSSSVWAQESAGKVHGYVFGDYFYKMSGEKAKAISSTQYSDSALRKSGAFQLRRLYLYYEHDISENFHATFLLEGNDKSVDWAEDKGDGKQSAGRHSMFIKQAFLEWKNIVKDQNLAFGMIPTITWSLSEKTWNYRSVEKTIADQRALGGASDIGVMVRGKFGNDGMFGYAAAVTNGNGQKPENNKSRKYYGSFSVKPIKPVVVEVYADHESEITNPKTPSKVASRTTLKGFTAYQNDLATVGLEVVRQTQSYTGSPKVKPIGWSLFSWAPVMKDKLNAFARYDSYNSDNQVGSVTDKEYFVTAGLDYMPVKNVHIMPNLWVNGFDSKLKRDADVVARVTFFYVYK